MPDLFVTCDSGAVFECGIEGWFDRPEEKLEWHRIVVWVLHSAFLSRSATLITTSPKPWSIGQELPEPRSLETSQGEYLVNHIEQCSSELLTEVADSEDFQRGLLCLTALDSIEEKHLAAASMQATALVTDTRALGFELLILLDDSRRICWFHPSRDPWYLARDVRNIAEELGWRVSG